jgi:hypothetical protein
LKTSHHSFVSIFIWLQQDESSCHVSSCKSGGNPLEKTIVSQLSSYLYQASA